MSPLLSVVIPIRNRTGVRLENCLTSLRWQSVTSEDVEIIISDFGSAPEERRCIQAAAQKHEARVVCTVTDDVWNRSRALNIGIQAATAELVLCTDCDMIFAPNFLGTVLDELASHQGRAIVLSRCLDLPEDVPEQPWQLEDFPSLVERATFRASHGTGACQATRRQWFVDVRGYDEEYVYWGFEDKDMLRRAVRSGLVRCWIHERTSMLHQWHPTTRRQRRLRQHLNKLRYRLTGWVIRKNRSGWGARS